MSETKELESATPPCKSDPFLDEVVRRLRWWRRSNLCKRFLKHWWREIEPGVFECLVCKSSLFDGASDEAFYLYFLGHAKNCLWWSSIPSQCNCKSPTSATAPASAPHAVARVEGTRND